MLRRGLEEFTIPATGQGEPKWASCPDDALLNPPECDLHLSIKDLFLVERITEIRELEERHLVFRPHFWLYSHRVAL